MADDDIDSMFDALLNDPELDSLLLGLNDPVPTTTPSTTTSSTPATPTTTTTPSTTNNTSNTATTTPKAGPPAVVSEPPNFAVPERLNFDFLNEIESSVLQMKGQIDNDLDSLQQSLDLLKPASSTPTNATTTTTTTTASTTTAKPTPAEPKIQEQSDTFKNISLLPTKSTIRRISSADSVKQRLAQSPNSADQKPQQKKLAPINTSALDELESMIAQHMPAKKLPAGAVALPGLTPQSRSQSSPAYTAPTPTTKPTQQATTTTTATPTPVTQPAQQPTPQPVYVPEPIPEPTPIPKPVIQEAKPLDLSGKSTSEALQIVESKIKQLELDKAKAAQNEDFASAAYCKKMLELVNKQKQELNEKVAQEAKEQERVRSETKAKEELARKAREEAERIAKEENERKAREEAEKLKAAQPQYKPAMKASMDDPSILELQLPARILNVLAKLDPETRAQKLDFLMKRKSQLAHLANLTADLSDPSKRADSNTPPENLKVEIKNGQMSVPINYVRFVGKENIKDLKNTVVQNTIVLREPSIRFQYLFEDKPLAPSSQITPSQIKAKSLKMEFGPIERLKVQFFLRFSYATFAVPNLSPIELITNIDPSVRIEDNEKDNMRINASVSVTSFAVENGILNVEVELYVRVDGKKSGELVERTYPFQLSANGKFTG